MSGDMSWQKALGLGVLLVIAGGCDKKGDAGKDRGAAPPPVESTKPGACGGGGGTVTDKVSAGFFPRVAGDYCLDPNGEARAYGENASGTVDKVCTELFDGECEVYKGFGLRRVVTLRYVDGKGSPGAVNVNLTHFATKEGAFGFFTKRVVADGDPVEVAPEALEAGGAGALGTGIAYVWRGEFVAELSYTNELESPDELKATSAKVVPPIAKEMGSKLPGETTPLPPVALLPEQGRVRLGVAFESRDALGVAGTGPAAFGYYKEGDKRWRVLALVRGDDAAAKDVLKTFGRLGGAKELKAPPLDGISFAQQDDEASPKVSWVVARKGNAVLGVGDEANVLSSGQSAEEAAKVRLTDAEKLERLKALLGG